MSLQGRHGHHILVIGGTGMLAGVCRQLAEDGYSVSVVARTTERLRHLAASARSSSGVIHPIAADYSRSAEFERALVSDCEQFGRPSLALCWIHNHSRDAAVQVAGAIGDFAAPADFYNILGSAAANPIQADAELRRDLKRRKDIRYHEITLGFKIENGQSRWLTHAEICAGILVVVRDGSDQAIIGTTTPWEMRP